MEIVIPSSTKRNKKYDARIDGTKTVSFGEKGASDHTKHTNPARKEAYLARHKNNENWGASGVKTAGFYSRWITWNKPTLKTSVDDIDKKFKSLNVKMK